MRAFSLLIGLGLTNAVDLPQDIIGEEEVIFILQSVDCCSNGDGKLTLVSLIGSPINITL